jgi:hypothetical protein
MSDEFINDIEAPSSFHSDDSFDATVPVIPLTIVSNSDSTIPLHLETPLANADRLAYALQEAKRVHFATSRVAADEGEDHVTVRFLPLHLLLLH